jgi:NADPH-dependent glutamate synthase beta subunit-like oxidoreductase/CO/xanthine dehydrogenase FAD-binding subunit
MKAFEFVNATTLEAAGDLLKERGEAAKAIAGGTDVLGVLKYRVHKGYPALVVNLKTIPGLDYVSSGGDGVAIGSLTRLHTLEKDPIIQAEYPLLAEAARAVASPQLRNMGTVGGNLCQEPRCWYYRYPGDFFDCMRKGGSSCNALTGENQYHSVFGSAAVSTRPCSLNCPSNVDIPSYMAELRAGDLLAAARILLEQNPLPAITGRVCPHYCEQNCNRDLYDEAVSVRSAERFLGDYVLDNVAEVLPDVAADGSSVAVVGAGPAGLACAYYVRRAGLPVTVFEKMPEAGGMTRYAIPTYRLSIETVRSQNEALERLGIEFRYGVEIGKDVQLDELRAGHAAVFVAPGGWGQPGLGLEGEELLTPGLPFLTQVKEGMREKPGDKVVVIGGGNVAVDVALTVKRLGATDVTMVCLECEDEMPALSWELELARAAGVTVYPSWGPGRILTVDGKLTGLELVRCSCVFDEQRRFAPEYDHDVRTTIEADQVFLAIGQRADLAGIDARGELRRGSAWVQADGETQATALPGVFAGGDAASGPSTVIAAIAAGRRAARSIIAYLGGAPAAAPGDSGKGHLNRFNASFLTRVPRMEDGEIAEATQGVEAEDSQGLAWADVEHEANRCFNCGCVAVSPSDLAPALVALGAVIKTTRRLLPAEEFFCATQAGSTALELGELVEEVRLPAMPAGTRQAFMKFRIRKSIDFPIVGVATVLRLESGKVAEARIVLGAVAPMPLRATEAEEYLCDRELSEEAAVEAARLVVAECIPLSRNNYKVDVLRALVKRALLAGA